MLRPPKVRAQRNRQFEDCIKRGAVAPHRTGPLPQTRDQIDERKVPDQATNGDTRYRRVLPPLPGFFPIGSPLAQHQSAPHRQQQQPKECEMHDRVVNIHHQKVPPIGADGNQVEDGGKDLDAITKDHSPGAETSDHKEGLKEGQTEARVKESYAREPENLLTEFMIDQSVGPAEVPGLEERLQKVDEGQQAYQNPEDIQR